MGKYVQCDLSFFIVIREKNAFYEKNDLSLKKVLARIRKRWYISASPIAGV